METLAQSVNVPQVMTTKPQEVV